MKKKTIANLIITVFFSLLYIYGDAQTPYQKFADIHQTYFGKFPKSISFIQKTDMYRADTVYKTQTWYEAGIFPNLFRIDFGHPKEGNSVIYRGDSTFNFRKSQKMKPSISPNILVYLLGGMYFEPISQVTEKLTKEGFDFSKQYATSWKGKPVIVVGVSSADDTRSQLWYDAKNKYLVRLIQRKEKYTLECHFDGQRKIGQTWHETHVKIFSDSKLIQTEEYSNFKINVTLQPSFFMPDQYGSWHWFKY